jgi:farnesyl-diphosphate farnesyltransferase
LLVEFDRVIDAFLDLKPEYQAVIQDITARMGEGMAEFLNKKVDSMPDWDRYCYYVAGLVGIGLSKVQSLFCLCWLVCFTFVASIFLQLFSASKLEDEWFGKAEEMANSMGLFLQKTNIIRDYLEDINVNRIFWPKVRRRKKGCFVCEWKNSNRRRGANMLPSWMNLRTRRMRKTPFNA